MISIIIDNYNYGQFLSAAIDSALSQTGMEDGDVEVIVVDDGSTDHSREIIAGYGGRVSPVFKVNGGQASAFNAGFAVCRGDIVIFLDADDMLLPHAARSMRDAFAHNPRLSKVMVRMDVIDAGGSKTGAVKPLPHAPLMVGDVRRYTLAGPGDTVWLPTSGNAFSARVLRQIMPIPEAPFRKCGDYHLCHVSTLYGEVAFLDDVGAQYRVHGANSFEQRDDRIDMAHVRAAIHNWHATQRELFRHARALGLPDCPAHLRDLTSVSDAGTRLLSLRLEPGRHPIASDTRLGLLAQGNRAIWRRPSIALAMRLIFMGWFMAMALAPVAVARGLARVWLQPAQRAGVVNAFLGRLQRKPSATPEAIHAGA